MNEEQMKRQMARTLRQAILEVMAQPYYSTKYQPGARFNAGQRKRGYGPKRATGQWINNLKVDWINTEDGEILAAYWEDIEDQRLGEILNTGRKPSLKYPPFDAIRSWIRVKPINFNYNNKPLSPESTTFLVARSIKEKGIGGIGWIEKAENKAIDLLTEQAEELMVLKFEELLDEGRVVINPPR